MSEPNKSARSEKPKSQKELREEALQKALRDNLRRRKAATVDATPSDAVDPQSEPPDKN